MDFVKVLFTANLTVLLGFVAVFLTLREMIEPLRREKNDLFKV